MEKWKGRGNMIVELISVGTELLMGNIVNTNANFLSRKCAELGFSLYHQVTVGDNEQRLCEALKTAMDRSHIVILSGGLGPTQDDMTKEATAKVLGKELLMDEHSKERIASYFDVINKGNGNSTRGLELISENNWKQALKIDGCIVVDNHNGTAPGYIVEEQGKVVILLPGPPSEIIPMFELDIFPYLKKLQNKVFETKMVKICGIGESRAETDILDLIDNQSNPTIAPYAKLSEVHFRVTASGDTKEEAEGLLGPVVKELQARFGDYIYSLEEEETLEAVVVKLLREKGLTLATAESCTGGLLSGTIVNVPGSSSVLKEGFVTYSNEAKMERLGVKTETLEQYGAVSEQTAKEMALGVAKVSGTQIGVGITGIAGPDGGTIEKPVGLVYIACAINEQVVVRELRMKGNRQKIREQSVVKGLDLIRRVVLG